MARHGARTARRIAWGWAFSSALGLGCAGLRSPLPPDAGIRNPVVAPPSPTPGPTPPGLPVPPPPRDDKLKVQPVPPDGPLTLDEVLGSVAANFPLLLAIEQEREIATGRRVSAEGAFDLVLRGGGTNQEGSFDNRRFDFSVEQPTPYSGLSTFAGYRLGLGDFPVYNGGQKTADGGEFRADFQLPLLRDGAIDRRRATLRQAQIAERLADPVIRRNQLDFSRAAARAYWAWVAAGQRYLIQVELLELATDRQKFLEVRVKVAKNQSQIDATENQRSIYDRQELLRAAELALQQAAFDLSVYICDADGNPVLPAADRLPPDFLDLDPPPVNAANLPNDVRLATEQRPEIARLRLLRERLAVDLKFAQNQFLPAVNVGGAVTQDAGPGKKTFTGEGPFASDSTGVNLFLNMELPVQRRDARGRIREATAAMAQLLYQERNQQNLIRAEIQDALARLEQTRQRLEFARKELATARLVVKQGTALVTNALQDVLFLNIREFNAAAAQTKVATLLADYYRAYADYLVALGANAGAPPLTKVPSAELEPAPPPKPAADPKKE